MSRVTRRSSRRRRRADLGIPAVVGAVGATSVIKTGDLVEVDGSNGVVRILERA
ncbi:MAG TPA: PEP-utilizing enzyme [Ilumatobacteraceae bacterium]|nr:PEP-utilizing enzyme [Ilumatobacteraceae bacterium]